MSGFDDFVRLIELKIGKSVNMEAGYKICDFKPMFGEIFADYLAGYEFWGNIDPDVIMGNFDDFVDDELLNRIDVYSGLANYVSGPFFFVRNAATYNRIWRDGRDIDRICSTAEYLYFDECGGRYWDELKAGKSIFECHTQIQSFTELIKLEERKGLRCCFRDTTLEPKGFEPVCLENGINYRKRDYMLVHLLYFKTRYYFTIPNRWVPYNFINSFGFFNYNPQSIRFWFSVHPINWVKGKVINQLKKLL
jgi:hypothetical protein